MHIFFKMMLVVSAVLFVGCGGGGATKNLRGQNDTRYKGQSEKISITAENYLKFVRAANYLDNLQLDNLPQEGLGIKEDSHIDKSTGLGYTILTYTDMPYNSTLINGTTRIDVLSLNETSTQIIAKIKTEESLTLNIGDNNISIHRIIRATVDLANEKEEFQDLLIEKYYIYDEKYKEHIDVVDFNSNPKLYIGSEGYVLIDPNSNNFLISGDNNTKLSLIFKDEEAIYETRYAPPGDPINGRPLPYQEKIYEPREGQGEIVVTLNSTKMKNLYFVPIKVSEYEPPKFYENYGNISLLEYSFYAWHTKYRLLNSDINNTQIKVAWFVNDVKIDTPIQYELPLGSFSASDTVKIVLTATHEDISIQRETILDSSANSYNVSSGSYEYPEDTYEIVYRTNSLEFDLDLLAHKYFENIDVNNSKFSWNMLNISRCQREDISGGGCSYRLEQDTKYKKIPRISARNYGNLDDPLYLIVYEGHEVKVVRFNITLMRGTSGIGGNESGDIIASIDEANITQDRYVATKVEHVDLDDNGLDDIIYTAETYDGGFLNVSYQNEKRIFTLEKIQNHGELFLGDYDGDGVKEAFMFGATEDASQLISLEKGNLHVVKDINLTNTQNILNVTSVADMNNDGKDDLIIANNQEKKLYIYENLDDLTQKRLVGASVCQGVQAIKDINSDGINDIICKPRRRETHDATTGLFSSELFIDYFLQESNGTYTLKTKKHTLIKDVTFNKASRTRVYGSTMLDDSKIVVSVNDGLNCTLCTYDLMNMVIVPLDKIDTNSDHISAFLTPTDVNYDGKVDLLYYRDYAHGELGIFYQLDDFSFDADYRIEMNTYNKLTNRFFNNAFLDDIDNNGSLEIVTVNGENLFSYINLK